jgi:ABC-type phosphate transport system substrate-binding protein
MGIWRGVLAFVMCSALVLGLAARPSVAASAPITLASNEWSFVALEQWASDVVNLGEPVAVDSIGDTNALNAYINGNADAAVSDMRFSSAQLQQLATSPRGRSFVYIPLMAEPATIPFHLVSNGHQVLSLNLSANTLCGIFTGQITNWDSPLIATDNPGLVLPDLAVVPVVRGDPSADAKVLSTYCDLLDHPAWAAFAKANHIPDAPTDVWPSPTGFVAEFGSDGVINLLASQNTDGYIGFDEWEYAVHSGVPVASVANVSGSIVAASATAVDVAASNIRTVRDYFDQVVSAPGAGAYPLTLISFAVAQTTGFDPLKGAALRAFLDYGLDSGQTELTPLRYAPLPANLIAIAKHRIKEIP